MDGLNREINDFDLIIKNGWPTGIAGLTLIAVTS